MNIDIAKKIANNTNNAEEFIKSQQDVIITLALWLDLLNF